MTATENQKRRLGEFVKSPQADVVLGMELTDYWGAVNAFIDNGDDGGPGLRESLVKPGTKLISISSVDFLTKANYQDFERYQAIDLAMAADAETLLPSLMSVIGGPGSDFIAARIERTGDGGCSVPARRPSAYAAAHPATRA
jgi:hypothetical protein